jgi:hypothetical protein
MTKFGNMYGQTHHTWSPLFCAAKRNHIEIFLRQTRIKLVHSLTILMSNVSPVKIPIDDYPSGRCASHPAAVPGDRKFDQAAFEFIM